MQAVSRPETGQTSVQNHQAFEDIHPNYQIIEAGIKDLDALMDWREIVLKEVFADTYPQDPKGAMRLMEANRRYYIRELGSGHHAYFVKNEQDEIVGCGGICLQHEMPSPDNPSGLCAYFMNIYTTPQQRHHGAAGLLVKTLIEESCRLGAGKIYLETSDAGRPLYEEIGFHPLEGYLKYE